MARRIGLGVLALSLALACGSSLPTPEIRAHPSTATQYLDVPYPPRGHWAKKEAGKPVVNGVQNPEKRVKRSTGSRRVRRRFSAALGSA